MSRLEKAWDSVLNSNADEDDWSLASGSLASKIVDEYGHYFSKQMLYRVGINFIERSRQMKEKKDVNV